MSGREGQERDRPASERRHPASATLAAVLHAPLPLDVEHAHHFRPATPPPHRHLPPSRPLNPLRTPWPFRLALPSASPFLPPRPPRRRPPRSRLCCLPHLSGMSRKGVQREAVDPLPRAAQAGRGISGVVGSGARVPFGADRQGGTDRKEQVGRHGVLISVFETRERDAAGRRGVGALLVARRQRRQLVGRRRTVADVALENEERPVTRGISLL